VRKDLNLHVRRRLIYSQATAPVRCVLRSRSAIPFCHTPNLEHFGHTKRQDYFGTRVVNVLRSVPNGLRTFFWVHRRESLLDPKTHLTGGIAPEFLGSQPSVLPVGRRRTWCCKTKKGFDRCGEAQKYNGYTNQVFNTSRRKSLRPCQLRSV
jgi:hypothetical protein